MTRISLAVGPAILAVVFAMVSVQPARADTITKEDEQFKLTITTKVNAEGKKEALIVVTPKTPCHNNLKFPWKITLKSGPGVTPNTKYRKTKQEPCNDFCEEKVTFEIITENSSQETVKAEIKMSQCGNSQCFIKKIELEW